ncbi:hypothetical protein [Murdochiella vaginalis]|nr:hypothetical protein [Murdochiella vaginalis]
MNLMEHSRKPQDAKKGNDGAIVEVEPPSAAFINRRPKAGSLFYCCV